MPISCPVNRGAAHAFFNFLILFNQTLIDSIAAHEKKLPNGRTVDIVRHDYLNRADKNENKLLSVETQCDWLRLIGYADVDVFFKCFELAVFAGRKLN